MSSESSATYVGYERVTGTLGGRSGSFVLQGVGTWEGGVAKTTWTVVPGSGTGTGVKDTIKNVQKSWEFVLNVVCEEPSPQSTSTAHG